MANLVVFCRFIYIYIFDRPRAKAKVYTSIGINIKKMTDIEVKVLLPLIRASKVSLASLFLLLSADKFFCFINTKVSN